MNCVKRKCILEIHKIPSYNHYTSNGYFNKRDQTPSSYFKFYSRLGLVITTFFKGHYCKPISILAKINITKTCLYNFNPHKPHFYIVKLGFTGVGIIFFISPKNIDCGYSLEPPRRGGSNEYPQSMFWVEIRKISEIFIWNILVCGDEIFYLFE